ncbi:ABC transporter permease [Eisenbergiella porci]|uniref:ABC transporter permease n=1 Tax=Eisenbergiella porci TaxID=2652274 RepID=UPI002A807697|nr:ABC transporter permease [Eisenbergiella porci]
MNLFKRAVLYTARKWQKSLLIFLIIFSVSTLIISGLAISDAQEEQSAQLRGATGVSFSVSRNTATGGWNSGAGGSYSTQEFLTSDMMEKIAAVEGIKVYNASIRTILSLSDTKGQWLEQMDPTGHAIVDCQFYSYSCINSEYHSLFLSGAMVMCDGKPIDTSIDDGIVISKEIADKHGLKVGDTIQAVNNPLSDDKTMELEIVGLFEVVVDKTDERNNFNEASYYDYTNNAFVSEAAMKELLENYVDVGYASADFFVTDPEQLEVIIQQVQGINSIDWNNFVITANDEVYERVANSISDMGSLISTLIAIISVVSVVIIVLILSMWMRSRTHEIGVLLAVGITKFSILMQYMLETLLIAVIAFPLSYLFAQNIAGGFGEIFGKTAANIFVTSQHFMWVALLGTVLLVLSIMISCIPVMRYRPKEILSKME